MKRKLILCLGNEIAGDDGVGIYIARAIAGKIKGWVVKESNKAGFYLLEDIEGYDEVLIVDSIISSEGEEGEILEGEITTGGTGVSPHSLSISETLQIGRVMGLNLPSRVRFMAIRIRPPSFSTKLSPKIKEAAHILIDRLTSL